MFSIEHTPSNYASAKFGEIYDSLDGKVFYTFCIWRKIFLMKIHELPTVMTVKTYFMKIHKMTFIMTLIGAMVLILVSVLIIRSRPAQEATAVPTPGLTSTSPTSPIGKDVDSFVQKLHIDQWDNGVSCQRCDLTAASLVEADLEGADLSAAHLWKADLSMARLADANLTGTDLESALLKDANLVGANLSGAKLFSADLSGADLSGASLIGADFFDADLDGVIGADFTGALNVANKFLGGEETPQHFEFVPVANNND